MTAMMIILAALALVSIVSTIVTVARDGYRRVPTRPAVMTTAPSTEFRRSTWPS